MDFNAPPGPSGMPFPQTAHVWADAVLWAIVAGLVLYGVREWRRSGSGLLFVLMAGGGIALLNEPVDDVLGLVWHPRPGQNTVLDTIGPVPMWGLPTYIIFFGAVPYFLLREFRKARFTLRAFWIGIVATFALDLAIELPLLQADLYTYYAREELPMTIAGFPLYWLAINTTGPILCAAILFGARDYFSGWRAPLVVLLPLAADAACSIVVGLPVYSALHAPGAGAGLAWLGAVVSCLVGLVILDAEARWILARTRALRERQDRERPPVTQTSLAESEPARVPVGARGAADGLGGGDIPDLTARGLTHHPRACASAILLK